MKCVYWNYWDGTFRVYVVVNGKRFTCLIDKARAIEKKPTEEQLSWVAKYKEPKPRQEQIDLCLASRNKK